MIYVQVGKAEAGFLHLVLKRLGILSGILRSISNRLILLVSIVVRREGNQSY